MELGHKRYPIFLSHNTMVCVSVYKSTDSFNPVWELDYIDARLDVKVAARDLVKSISDECSIRMLWELREALAEEIDNVNKEWGTKHPKDNPKEG